MVRVHESRSRSGSQSARGTNPPTRCSQTGQSRKEGAKADRPGSPEQGNPMSQRASESASRPRPGFATFSVAPNAGAPALFHCGAIASRASNILPDSGAQFHRDETNRQTVDANITPSFAGRPKLLSKTVPVPVRPQWGQQSATAQAFNAVIMQVYLRFMTFVRRLRVGILCWAAHRICSKLHTSRGRTAVWRDLLARHPRQVVGSSVSQAAVARS